MDSTTTIPSVLNKRRDAIPKGAVYIGRPSKYGNPFSHLPGKGSHRVPTREDAVGAYRVWLEHRLWEQPDFLDDLKGASALVCWCSPLECHGDVIQEALAGIGVFSR